MTDANGFLMGTGGKSASFKSVGDSVDGYIVTYDLRQQTDFRTKKPKFFDDGNPMMQVVATLQTNEQDDDDDDGIRNLYIKGQMRAAVQKAVAETGERGLGVNGRLWVKYVGDGEAKGDGFPPKQYQAKYVAPVVSLAGDDPDDAPPFDDADAPF